MHAFILFVRRGICVRESALNSVFEKINAKNDNLLKIECFETRADESESANNCPSHRIGQKIISRIG